MKRLVLGVLAAVALGPAAFAQDPPRPTLDHPSARNGLDEQLSELAARIEHRRGDGRLSSEQAIDAQREVNDLQAEISQKRAENGGQLTEHDRFDLQERIHRLIEKIDQESAPTHR